MSLRADPREAERELLREIQSALLARGRMDLVGRLGSGDPDAAAVILSVLGDTGTPDRAALSAVVEGGHVDRIVQVGRAQTVSVKIEHLTLVQTPSGAMLDPAPTRPAAAETLGLRRAGVRPRPFPELLGRSRELAQVARVIAQGEEIEYWGEPGRGKTSLAREVANGAVPEHGVVFCDADLATPEDLYQHLLIAFTGDPRPVATPARLRALLQDARALIVVDDLALTPDELRRLLDIAPRCAFVLFSNRARLTEDGRCEQLGGLPEEAALALFERHCPGLDEEQRAVARRAVASLGGDPRRVVGAASAVARGLTTLDELTGATDRRRGLVRSLLGGLAPAERRVLDALAASGGGPLDGVSLAAASGDAAADRRAEDLCGLGLLLHGSPSYRLPADVADELDGPSEEEVAVALDAIGGALERGARPPAAGLLAAADAGAAAGRWRQVTRLAMAAEAALVAHRRFGTWGRLLASGLEAARRTGDAPAEALLLHELGSRALCLGDRDDAARRLREALRLREELDDTAGAALTRHNLRLLAGTPPTPNGDGAGRPRWPWLGGLAVLVVAGVIGGVLATTRGGDAPPPPPPPPDARLAVEPPDQDFGNVTVSRRAAVPVTLRWHGEDPVGLGIAWRAGTNATGDFGWRGCEVVLSPRLRSCDLEVSFTPRAAGSQSAVLAIRPQLPGERAVTVTLRGRGDSSAGGGGAGTTTQTEPPLGVRVTLTLSPEYARPEGPITATVELVSGALEEPLALSADPPELATIRGGEDLRPTSGDPATAAIVGNEEGTGAIVASGGGVERARAPLVVDGTEPTLTVHSMLVWAPTEGPPQIPVEFDPEPVATDAVDGPVTPTCSPSSGSLFDVRGTTTVDCSAVDRAGNRTDKSFTVSVRRTPG